MNIEHLLTMRRTLRAVQQGLPVDEALLLIENLFDDIDYKENWDRLDSMLKAALQGNRQWLDEMLSELKGLSQKPEEK